MSMNSCERFFPFHLVPIRLAVVVSVFGSSVLAPVRPLSYAPALNSVSFPRLEHGLTSAFDLGRVAVGGRKFKLRI